MSTVIECLLMFCCCCLVIYNFEILPIIFCSSLLLTCMKSMFHSCSYLVCAHLLMTSFFYFKMPQINLISCLVASIIFSPTSILYALASFAQINWLQQALITEYRCCLSWSPGDTNMMLTRVFKANEQKLGFISSWSSEKNSFLPLLVWLYSI